MHPRRTFLALLLATPLAGCAARPRPLAVAEAERLALARFTNHEAATARFRAELPTAGQRLRLHGLLDWRHHVGTAVLRTDGRTDDAAQGLLQWGLGSVAFHPGGAVDGDPPAPPEDGRWQARALGRTDLDALLALLLNLAAERPENPQLLVQGGARYLRADSVDGTAVDVVTGPVAAGAEPRVSYWLAGERLRRVEARLGDAREPAVIDLTAAPDVTVAALPGLTDAPTG